MPGGWQVPAWVALPPRGDALSPSFQAGARLPSVGPNKPPRSPLRAHVSPFPHAGTARPGGCGPHCPGLPGHPALCPASPPPPQRPPNQTACRRPDLPPGSPFPTPAPWPWRAASAVGSSLSSSAVSVPVSPFRFSPAGHVRLAIVTLAPRAVLAPGRCREVGVCVSLRHRLPHPQGPPFQPLGRRQAGSKTGSWGPSELPAEAACEPPVLTRHARSGCVTLREPPVFTRLSPSDSWVFLTGPGVCPGDLRNEPVPAYPGPQSLAQQRR
ncbi:WAS/WASL-interacting protein family member 3-like [Acinonyx jubatus]|uniref:WAS/WASL-interacting protein family member 3-like n=1 Tax=Acinonyx jubatus TaxID=32536 RepID=A0ABM3P1Y1_ACIJB|nr:WAS/WASL-interacting protein family member 3-like [Acinonyx jubatus]